MSSWQGSALMGAGLAVLCGTFVNLHQAHRTPDEILARLLRKRLRDRRRQHRPETAEDAAVAVLAEIKNTVYVKRPRAHFCSMMPDCPGCGRRYYGTHRHRKKESPWLSS